jgi:hypothetical protein
LPILARRSLALCSLLTTAAFIWLTAGLLRLSLGPLALLLIAALPLTASALRIILLLLSADDVLIPIGIIHVASGRLACAMLRPAKMIEDGRVV